MYRDPVPVVLKDAFEVCSRTRVLNDHRCISIAQDAVARVLRRVDHLAARREDEALRALGAFRGEPRTEQDGAGLAVAQAEPPRNFFAAGVTTVVLLAALVGLRAPRQWIRRRIGRSKDFVIIRLPGDADAGAVMSAITALEGVEVRSMSVAREDDQVTLEVFVHTAPGVELASHFASIASRDDVKGVEIA